jgi:predicted transcriptional regulator
VPVEGFETITVSSDLYQRLQEVAEKTQRSIPKVIEYLLKNCKEA